MLPAPGEDVGVYLRQAKLLTDGLAATVPQRTFNATAFHNVSDDYGDAITTLAIWQMTVGFDKLLEILRSHQIRLKMKESTALLHRTPSPATFDDAVKTSHYKRPGGHSGKAFGSKSGGRTVAQPKRDPCPVCGIMGDNPYKCQYWVAAIQHINNKLNHNGLNQPNLAQYPQTPAHSINSYQTPNTPQYQPNHHIQPMTNHTTISESHFIGNMDHSFDNECLVS